MEAAVCLILEGLLNIPDVGTINVKQARAFLWNVAWLQGYMSARWRDEDVLATARMETQSASFANLALIIMGPGGAGKTGVLNISEALAIFLQVRTQSGS